jgi:hypothetical protein
VWGDYWHEYLGKPGVFGRIIERLTAHLTNTMIAVSAKTKTGLEHIVRARNNIKIIPNGVDFTELADIK